MKCVYTDPICHNEPERGEKVEMVVDIYESVDVARDHDPDAETEDPDTKEKLQTHHAGNSAWCKCYSVTVVCLVVLCVLLLTAITMLWIKYNNLNTENSQLHARHNNLTIERDVLQRDTIEIQRLSKLGWIFHSSSLYYISTEMKNWNQSRNDCRQKGADLVIINSQEEQKFINYIHRRDAWVGLSDRDKEGEWKWVDGTPLTAGYWNKREPNGNGNEDCAVTGYLNDPEKNWADYPCNSKFTWICEIRIFT